MNDDKNFRKKAKSRRKAKVLENYSEQLDRTCVLWPNDAFQQIKKTEDKLFLESMITDRKASLGKIDVKFAKQESTKRKREEKGIERSTKCKKVMTEQYSSVSHDHVDQEIENISHETDNERETPELEIKRKHKRIVRPGTHIFVPHDILYDQDLQQHCERLGMTPTQTASVIRKFVEKTGGDPSKIACSYSTADRYRQLFSLS